MQLCSIAFILCLLKLSAGNGFIIWLKGKFFSQDRAGNPERARWLHLAHSHSQSQHAIWFILPTYGASHVIKCGITLRPLYNSHFPLSSRWLLWRGLTDLHKSDVHVKLKICTYLNIGPMTLETTKHTNIRPMKERITSNSIHKVFTNSSDKQ